MAQDIAIPSTHYQLWENEIYQGNYLDDKQSAYYYLRVSDRFFSGKESLAIRVIPEAFDSDPDIFISKVSF